MKKIWIDCDNSPHVLYLRPFIKIAKDNSFTPIVTSRNNPEILELCNHYKLGPKFIGKSTPKNKMLKVAGTIWRALLLYNYLKNKDILFSISCSRSCALASRILKIPSFIILDFEYANTKVFAKMKSFLIVPDVIPKERFIASGIPVARLIRFDGFKEHFYLDSYPFIEKEYLNLPIDWTQVIAIVRPEGKTAHYRTKKTAKLEIKLLSSFSNIPNVKFIFVPRDEAQRRELERIISDFNISAIILKKVVDGPSLIKYADLVFTGGGTMARESAVLNTPAYSYFGGRTCAVDEYLASSGLLTILEKNEDIKMIEWKKKTNQKTHIRKNKKVDLVASVWKNILDYIEIKS